MERRKALSESGKLRQTTVPDGAYHAVLELDEDGWRAERVDIPDETPQRKEKDAPQKCGRRSIEAVLKRMEKGQTVSRIAEELKLEPAFVEEICRIKVTHPGVTALGILDKMEVNKTGR